MILPREESWSSTSAGVGVLGGGGCSSSVASFAKTKDKVMLPVPVPPQTQTQHEVGIISPLSSPCPPHPQGTRTKPTVFSGFSPCSSCSSRNSSVSCSSSITTDEKVKQREQPPPPPPPPPLLSVSVPTQPPVPVPVQVQLPFFIMDWLDQVNEHDLMLAQKMLRQTPPHQATTATDTPSVVSSTSFSSSSSLSLTFSLSPSPRLVPKKKESSSESQQSESQQQQQPLSIFRKRSIAVGNAWNAKGLAQAKLGNWDKARTCWENALEIREQVLGETHLDVANTCNNLGIALGKLNQTDEALTLLQRALTIRQEQLLGKDKDDDTTNTNNNNNNHPEIAATLHNMGNVLQQMGRLDAAVDCFHKAKQIYKQCLGPDHVQVARAYVAIGHTYYQALQYKPALKAYSDALAIFQWAEEGQVAGHMDNVEIQNLKTDIQELSDKLWRSNRETNNNTKNTDNNNQQQQQ